MSNEDSNQPPDPGADMKLVASMLFGSAVEKTTPNSMNPNEICELCKEPRSKHSEFQACCLEPLDQQWHPVNRFTPRKEEAKCSQCQGTGIYERGYGKEPCQACRPKDYLKFSQTELSERMREADGKAAQPACPPGRLPFDLGKALKGAELVTRAGERGEDFAPSGNKHLYTCQISGKLFIYNGRGFLFESFDGDCSLDLFLAGEECEQCHGKGWMVCHGGTEPCDKCRPEDCQRFRQSSAGCGAGMSAPPPPETETQRQAQSEIDRQIEVMKASREKGAVVERKSKLVPNAPWEPSPNPAWNWQAFDFRIKPAETKPRVVWCVFQTDGEPAHFQGYSCAPLPVGWTESKFIELNPEVLSAIKAAGIEIEKETK